MASPDPGDWEDLIIICAANSYDTVKVADQHVAEQMSRLAPILYVDPPLSRLSPAKNPELASALTGPRLRVLAPGLARLTPVVQPFPSRPGMAGLTTALVARHIRHAASTLGGRVRALVSAWPLYPVFGSAGERVRVYWAQDDFVGGAALLGMNARQLDVRERRVARAADVIIAANPVVADTWRDRGYDPVVIPYGADVASYSGVDQAPRPADVSVHGPVAGFVGQVNDRTDLSLLEAVADLALSLLIVGPVNPAFEPDRFHALRQRPNVCWVGPKPFEALPGYLRMIDVGLVPYRDTPFNRGSFPLKTLEYLAAGRAVVATDLPAIRWLDTDLISVATTPAAFGGLVERLAAEPRTQALMARRRTFAAGHSWARRAADINAAIAAAKERGPLALPRSARQAAQDGEPLGHATAQLLTPVADLEAKPVGQPAGEAEIGVALVEWLVSPVFRLREREHREHRGAVIEDTVEAPVGLERHVPKQRRHRGNGYVVQHEPAADFQRPGNVVPVDFGKWKGMRSVDEGRVEHAVTAKRRRQDIVRQAHHEIDPAVIDAYPLAVLPDPAVLVSCGTYDRVGSANRREQNGRCARACLDGRVALLY